MENDEAVISDWSSSAVDDSEDLGAYILSDSRRPLNVTKAECETVKVKLVSNLRIGSALDIGEHFSAPQFVRGFENSPESMLLQKCLQIRQPIYFSPISLLVAREQGSCRPSSRYNTLRDFYAIHLSNYKAYDKPTRWPLNQSFQRHIRGSLWSVSSLGLSDVYQYHTGCVNALNFNQSGHLIASGSDDTYVAITDSYTGELKARFPTGHSRNVFNVKFVPNSNDLKLVTSARDGMVRLAELCPDGRAAWTTINLANHQEACHKLVFVPDEPSLLLTCGEDGSVFSIDLRTKKTEQLLYLPLSPIYSISANPTRSSEFCISGKYESVVRVFDRRKISVSSPKSGYLYSFAPHHLSKWQRTRPDSTEAECEVSPVVDDAREHDATDGNQAGEYDDGVGSGEHDSVEDGFFSSRLGRQLIGLLQEDLRRQGRVSSPPELGDETEGHGDPGRRSRGGSIRLHDRIDPLGDHSQTKYSITSAVYSSNGDAILASFNDEDIYLFNAQNDKLPPLHVYRGHRNNDTVKGVSFYGPNSEFVVSGSDDGFIYIWDRHSEGIVQWLCGDIDGAVNVLEPHPVYPMLATSGCDHNVKIWTPISQNAKFDRPETWLQVIKNKEPSQRPLFDPEQIVNSMQSLRRSNLAKHFFGENNDFQLSDKNDDGNEHVGVDAITNTQRKRKFSEVSRGATSGSAESSVPIKFSKLPIMAAPQEQLPFNSMDLQLRVAANWASRTRNSRTFTFSFGLPDFLRPTVQADPNSVSHRIAYFLRNAHSAIMSDDSSDDDEDNGPVHLGEVVEPTPDQVSGEGGAEDTNSSTFSSSCTSETINSSSLDSNTDSVLGA